MLCGGDQLRRAVLLGVVVAGLQYCLPVYAQPQTAGATLLRSDSGIYALQVAFSPDGKLAALIGGEHYGQIQQWELQSKAAVDNLWSQAPWSHRILAFEWIGDQSIVIARQDMSPGYRTHVIEIWSSAGQATPLGRFEGWVSQIECSEDGRRLAVAGFERTSTETVVTIWDLTERRKLTTIRQDHARFRDMKFFPDHTTLVTLTSEPIENLSPSVIPYTSRPWNSKNGDEHVHQQFVRDSHLPIVTGLFPAPRGESIFLAVGEDNVWMLYSLDTREHIHTLPVPVQNVACTAYCRQRGIVAVSYRPSNTVLYDIQTGEQIREYHHADFPAISLAFSPDGRYLAAGSVERRHSSTGVVLLWNLPMSD